MSDNASPFFIRPHRFDEPAPDSGAFPRLDRVHQVILEDGEQVLWQGRLDVAGYLVGVTPADRELCWALPRPAQVTLTDRRLAYVCGDWDIGVAAGRGRNSARHRFQSARTRVATGQIRWQWPTRLQLLPPAASDAASDPRPGASLAAPSAAGSHPPDGAGSIPPAGSTDRPDGDDRRQQGPAVGPPGERLLFVCDALRATRRPSLALAGGGPGAAAGVRDVAAIARLAIARFRLVNANTVELSPPERDGLRAHLRPPYDGGMDELARGVTLPGALLVEFLHRDDYYRWSPRPPRRRLRTGGAPAATPTPPRPGAS